MAVRIIREVGRPLNVLKPMTQWAVEVGVWVQQWMETNDRNATGGTSESITVTVTKPNEVILSGAPNLEFSLAGRGSGAPPPIGSLLEWANTAKGLRIANEFEMEPDSLAWAARFNIAKRGTAPGTPKLRAQNITLVINQKGRKYLEEMGEIQAREASAAMVELLTKSIPNTTAT